MQFGEAGDQVFAVHVPAHSPRFPGAASGSRVSGPCSPRLLALAPSTPRPVARPCSPTSQLLLEHLTSPIRTSLASAPRLPNADLGIPATQASSEISRFTHKEHLYMPGSLTTPGRPRTRDSARERLAFRFRNSVGIRGGGSFSARWLAYTLPCRRFACLLAKTNARLGANVGRYSFIATDLHRLLLAGLYRRTPGNRSWSWERGSKPAWMETCRVVWRLTLRVGGDVTCRSGLARDWTRSIAGKPAPTANSTVDSRIMGRTQAPAAFPTRRARRRPGCRPPRGR